MLLSERSRKFEAADKKHGSDNIRIWDLISAGSFTLKVNGEKPTVPQIGCDNKAHGAELCGGTYRFRGCTRISCTIVLRLLFRSFKLPSQQSGGLMYEGPRWMDYAAKPARGTERRFDARSHFLRDRLSRQLRYGPFSRDGVSHDLLSYHHSEASLGSFCQQSAAFKRLWTVSATILSLCAASGQHKEAKNIDYSCQIVTRHTRCNDSRRH